MINLLNILWIFLLPLIIMTTKDVVGIFLFRDLMILLITGMTHTIGFNLYRSTNFDKKKKILLLYCTSLLYTSLFVYFIFIFNIPSSPTNIFIFGLYNLYLLIPFIINVLTLTKLKFNSDICEQQIVLNP
jgi:hypothetical protein